MKVLIEIANIVTKKKVKKIEIFDEYSLRHKNSKFNEFYNDLTSGRYKNDRDAATKLYECSPQDARYRQLKSRFRKRLLNTLFFLDMNKPGASNYETAHYTCQREWALVKILQDNDAHLSAISLAKSLLTTSVSFHLSDVVVDCARLLRQYAAQRGDDKEFEEYDNILKDYTTHLEAELRSEELYQRVIMDFYKPLNANNNLGDRIQLYSETLLSLSEIYDVPAIYYNMFLVWAMRYEMNRQFDALLEVCNQAERYMDEHTSFYQESKLIDIFTKKMSAYLHLKNFAEGQLNAERCLNRFPEGSKPWFLFKEYHLLLALHTGRDIPALAIYNGIVEHKAFAKQEVEIRERIGIIEALLHFKLIRSGMASRLSSSKKKQPFLTESFIQRKPAFSSDLKPLLLLTKFTQVLFLLKLKKYPLADELIDELQQLANRALDKELYYRHIQFIRLLIQLRKAEYVVVDVRNTEKYLDRLHETPFMYRGVLSQFEPVPFEDLWATILEID